MIIFKKLILSIPFVKKEFDNLYSMIEVSKENALHYAVLVSEKESTEKKYQISQDVINEKNKKIFDLEEQIKNTILIANQPIIIPPKCLQTKKSKKPKSKKAKL